MAMQRFSLLRNGAEIFKQHFCKASRWRTPYTRQSSKQADWVRPEPENISPNPAPTRKLIWSPNHAQTKPKVNLGLKNSVMLPSYFDYNFVLVRQKARL